MSALYKLDFPDGKSYIGITSLVPELRFSRHAGAARRGSPYLVHQAWRLQGAPNLTVLAFVSDEDLADTERRAIRVFGTLFPFGLNQNEGGNLSPMRDPDVVAKMAETKRGKKRPDMLGDKNPRRRPEVIALMSGDKNPMRRPEVLAKRFKNGNPFSDPEVRKKITATRKLNAAKRAKGVE